MPDPARPDKKAGRLSALTQRLDREKLARSFSVFLLGIVIACGIEVAVDWHSTLTEIRILHEHVRERGRNYVAVLVRPLAPVASSRDVSGIERLVGGVFDDQDVVFARVVAPDGTVLFERLEPAFGAAFAGERGLAFGPHYAHQLDRDIKGILQQPEVLRERMEASRHRDFAQAYQDLLVWLHVTKREKPRARRGDTILFQDRLYTADKKKHDSAVTYAIGRIEDEGGKAAGVVIVAFDMRATNSAIFFKYLKGAGMVAFFVLLILVQNVTGRREKLRLLDLEAKYGGARRAIASALPGALEAGPCRAAGAIAQSTTAVDGMLWDGARVGDALELVVVDPEGDGIEVAAVALHVCATYRQRREQSLRATLREELEALAAAARRIPGSRSVGVMLVRVASDGRMEGLGCGMGAPLWVDAGAVTPLEAVMEENAAPAGVVGPMNRFAGELPSGAALVMATNGLGGRPFDARSVGAFVARARAQGTDLKTVAGDAAAWARGSSPEAAADDLVVVVVERN